MGKRTFWAGAAIGGLAAFAAGVYVGSQLPQQPTGREPHLEAVEDPDVTVAYNGIMALPHIRFLKQQIIWGSLPPHLAGRAIDLGCGPGQLVIDLARRYPALHVTGLDLSAEMLALARDNADRAGLGHCTAFKLGNAEDVPFPDDYFDLAVSTLSLHHWTVPRRVLDEMARITRPGGHIGVYDLRRDMPRPLWTALALVTQTVLPGPLRRVGGPLTSIAAAYRPDEATQLVAQSDLAGWETQVSAGPAWLVITGHKPPRL
ncbi:MAG: class I SAM-dependent methyltransferase [Chloroflexi bacterium]|nr:class I SAM-dependent methyltransferase [Chloroflexota bacterium]MBU1750531.1 class I SAM-dependent methyltransferase [Chloroflexota bacterium]